MFMMLIIKYMFVFAISLGIVRIPALKFKACLLAGAKQASVVISNIFELLLKTKRACSHVR